MPPASAADYPEWNSSDARCVRRIPGGPVLVRGPVKISLPDGSVVASDRFVVAVCMCRRSRIYPLCDTSHRSRRCPGAASAPIGGGSPPG
ncbi:CDGSH iron-sulfur domain-containing protein [Rhodococcus sp. UNC363MFTsu5.1]|uniref:CDGSH iron-sulfur domain-containing protein n=1 Tax=Rhodococcus sp. UNC363MFTsu5.1 TaxID=1449069 RepID=UPI0009DED598|nr:CDGSH iron-sulfur domain-containing protein [Rhodococcus sp. UNC363MFTsu5.1]